ncbi:hypothetical protein LPJ81_003858, partial [Coemansia sp. IMI 209127]
MEEFMTKSEDEHRYSGDVIESIKWSEAEILSNTSSDTSGSYNSFVAGLGWKVDLRTFPGYTGKLEDCGSDGTDCPYFADDGLEVAFHEATSMPTSAKDPRQLNK